MRLPPIQRGVLHAALRACNLDTVVHDEHDARLLKEKTPRQVGSVSRRCTLPTFPWFLPPPPRRIHRKSFRTRAKGVTDNGFKPGRFSARNGSLPALGPAPPLPVGPPSHSLPSAAPPLAGRHGVWDTWLRPSVPLPEDTTAAREFAQTSRDRRRRQVEWRHLREGSEDSESPRRLRTRAGRGA